VHLQGVGKSFGPNRAVDGIDLDISPGEIVALLGPNGAGKSTAIDMLLGLKDPDEGEIRVFGDVPTVATAKGRVGAMLQAGGLPSEFSVLELIELIGAFYPTSLPTDEVLDRARITDLASRRGDKLSGGQKQRVRFALAIVPDPDLLVLDEPTAAMDVESRQVFWASMREWASSGRTVLFATHYLEEADNFADRIVLLRQGRIVADGATTEVRALAGGRTLRCTMTHADLDGLGSLPGVTTVSVHGHGVSMTCADSDATVRALLDRYPEAHDIEIGGAGLSEAFLALTATPGEEIHS
jgi:ABC-2 type transport system ATP-binding protein